ncbi:MAG: NlpC/P60 family N-terminal domain-containing protein [Desulfovibrionaceae bacterium]|nr:NlpC/P60 family N-terminal domain-containing protein [Desulfovibrionaceae bacterium]
MHLCRNAVRVWLNAWLMPKNFGERNKVKRLVVAGAVSLLAAGIMLSGCAGKKKTEPIPTGTELPVMSAPAVFDEDILDIRMMPQDLHAYTGGRASVPLIGAAEQARLSGQFLEKFFRPWSPSDRDLTAKEALWGLPRRTPRGKAENLLRWSPARWAAVAANADRETFPSRRENAVTVHPTALRTIPSLSPILGGAGYPFDDCSISMLPAGMPQRILHVTRDGRWSYVVSSLCGGWVESRDLALTDAVFEASYQTGRYAAVLRDGVPLRVGQTFLTAVHIGTVLPMKSNGDLLLPVRNAKGRAELVAVKAPAGSVAPMPLACTPAHAASIGNAMMGQPYGWGGYLENRDCSQMTRDMMVPFGLWLPRNSGAQYKAWKKIPFAAQASPQDKEKLTLAKGIPFFTLVYLKGHIMLYVGEYGGRPAVFHNMWGVRTEQYGKEGRHLVGRAVVTTLSPGRELPNLGRSGSIINRLVGIAVPK